MRDKTPCGQERWFNAQESLLLLQKPGVWVPAPYPEAHNCLKVQLLGFYLLFNYMSLYMHTCTHIHRHTQKNNLKNK